MSVNNSRTRPMMFSPPKAPIDGKAQGFRATLVVLWLILVPSAFAQERPVQEHETLLGPVQLPVTSRWIFGLKIVATGDSQGVQGTVPVPTDWPEQTVKVISINRPDGVKVARIREKDGASELFFNVPAIAGGAEVEVTVEMEITKHASDPPASPDGFSLVKKPAGSLRKFLTPSPFIESDDKRIVEIARSLPVSESDPGWEQVRVIYNWVRENVEYEFDTEIRSCLDALDRKRGDCEELSSLFIALCRARGIPARAVWIPSHTYPEFYLEDNEGNGHWFPCQAAGDESFGVMPEARPILQKGDKFRVPGERGDARYLKPSVEARHSDGNLEVAWIMREVPPAESPIK
jgi:Transglutaminase-like superfamily